VHADAKSHALVFRRAPRQGIQLLLHGQRRGNRSGGRLETASTESPAMSMTRPAGFDLFLNTARATSSATTVALSSAAIRRE
jgi:hypothetical protein